MKSFSVFWDQQFVSIWEVIVDLWNFIFDKTHYPLYVPIVLTVLFVSVCIWKNKYPDIEHVAELIGHSANFYFVGIMLIYAFKICPSNVTEAYAILTGAIVNGLVSFKGIWNIFMPVVNPEINYESLESRAKNKRPQKVRQYNSKVKQKRRKTN